DALSIVRVNERETVDPRDVGFARVVEKSFISVLLLARRIDEQDAPGNAVDELPEVTGVLAQRSLLPFMLDRHRREVRHLLDQCLILVGWNARLAPVNRERAQ